MNEIIQGNFNKEEIKMGKPDVNFYPWVGINYLSGFEGKGKLMILGESLYWGDYKNDYSIENYKNDLKHATISTVELYLNRREPEEGETNVHWKKTYTILSKICLGKSKKETLTKEEKGLFWDSILFYNYLNEPLKTSRQIIEDALWQKSKSDFYKVLKFYKPDFILILGDRLWNHTPIENWVLDKNDKNLGCYSLEGNNIFASSIYHTSSRYPYGTKDFDSKTIFNKLINTHSITI